MKAIGLLALTLAASAHAWTLSGGNLSGWNTHQLAIQYNPAGCPITESELTSAIDFAIDQWNSVPTAGITLVRASAAVTTTTAQFLTGAANPSPVIVCDQLFTADLGDGDTTFADFVPAATLVATSSDGHVDYGGIILNGQPGAGAEISQLTRDQLLITLSHEMGHVLGLGHSSAHNSLMYYSIGNKTQVVLSQDDADGVSFLYPRSEFQYNPFGCAAVHGSKSSPLSLLWIVVFLAGTVGLGRLVQRRTFPD